MRCRAGWPTLLLTGLLLLLSQRCTSAAETGRPSLRSKPASLIAKTDITRPEAVELHPRRFEIRGSNASEQLVLTGHSLGQPDRDLTEQARFRSSDPDVARVTPAGLVVPVSDGTVTITATVRGLQTRAEVSVSDVADRQPINFANEIVPIFTKFGCNAGGCHGKASGQNGFKLSLLGFDPAFDYESLTREGRGRRVFPAAPDLSLLLRKPSAILPHGGGKRLDPDSAEYGLLRRWIASGMPFGMPGDPKVVALRVWPEHRILGHEASQQLAVTALYSDGSAADITRMAQYQSNDDEVAGVDQHGRVRGSTRVGEAAVMARYQGLVAVFRATVPVAEKISNWPDFEPATFVDRHVFSKLKELGIPPSPLCTDAEFLRRVSLDATGTLPTAAEVEAFLADPSPTKRQAAIDNLVGNSEKGIPPRPEFAEFFANKWADVLHVRIGRINLPQVKAAVWRFREWLRASLAQNKPYDQFVRELLAAKGDAEANPGTIWFSEVRQLEDQTNNAAQVFLGMRLECAHCHHHPYEKWSQDDYYGFASFFSRVGRKGPGGNQRFFQNPAEVKIFPARFGAARNPRTGQLVKPHGLDAEPLDLPPGADPRDKLVDWLVQPDNPYFARAFCNRIWAHFFGRGLVEPLDDMRVTNPPSNPALLDALADDFVAHKFDINRLIRVIVGSKTYQLSSTPNPYNKDDRQNFSRAYARRLPAEVLLDAINQATGATDRFNGMPPGTRAIQLPDEQTSTYFLDVFGRPKRETACECERSSEANLSQSLHLLNSADIQAKLSSGSGRAAQLAADRRPEAEKIRELYLTVYGRYPDSDESAIALTYIRDRTKRKKQAYEDLLWALINTKEFLFNH